MPSGRTGFQPRNTPAERRAFFDLQRKIDGLEPPDLTDYATKAYVDGKFSAAVTVTPQVGWQHYGGSYGQVRVVRSGNMVNLQGLIQATVATTGGSSMVSIPSGYRPVQQVIAGQMTSTGSLARVDVTTAGVATLNAIPAVSIPINGWVALNLSWAIP